MIAQDTKLDSNVVGCPREGVLIRADRVTLDLNGHVISGAPDNEYIGVWSRGDGITIRGGTVMGFGAGVLIEGSRNTVKALAVLDSPQSSGIQVSGHENLVAKNVLVNDGVGVYVQGGPSSDNRVTKNDVSGGVTGIIVELSEGDLVEKNTVTGTSLYGIAVAFSTGVLVRDNTATRSGRSGIATLTPGTTLTRNVANDNGIFGIEAAEGTIDGGGNRASGNGNPLQCLNVFCK